MCPVFVSDVSQLYSEHVLIDCQTVVKNIIPNAVFVLFDSAATSTSTVAESSLGWLKDLHIRLHAALDESFLDCAPIVPNSIFFSCITHSYVRACLALFPRAKRVLFPHGLDCPRDSMIADTTWLYSRRSVSTWLSSLSTIATSRRSSSSDNSHISKCELYDSLMRTLAGHPLSCVPYSGTDRILTFRNSSLRNLSGIAERVSTLSYTLQCIADSNVYADELTAWITRTSGLSVMVLLLECERAPIFAENTAWLDCHCRLIEKAHIKCGHNHFTIKAHPRSDGSAAAVLAEAARKRFPHIRIEVLPPKLAPLPVELFAFKGSIVAACSLGSASLPEDIGLPATPHYTSPSLADIFDNSWVGSPFWLKFGLFLRTEIAANRFLDLDCI